jgi:hypothetical protein
LTQAPQQPDPFDVQSLRLPQAGLAALQSRTPVRPPRHRRGEKFLKGPIPWVWLERAFGLRGKALQVALLLWFEAGCRKSRTVRLCLSGHLPTGLNRQSARRGLRALAGAGLVRIAHAPGQGLEVTLLDAPDVRGTG